MSLWNRIGDVAATLGKTALSGVGNAAKFAGEIAVSAGNAARFAWDVGTAPWNDNEQYNGFINTFKSASAKNGGNIIKPLASAGGAIMKVPGVQPAIERINYINREYIREPLTTFALVESDIVSGRIDQFDIFDPNAWRKAYKGAQEISFGQAVLGVGRAAYDPKFNIYDPREREAAFKKSAWGKYLSGGLDLGIQFFGDVSLAAGKVGKVVKASTLGTGKLKNADAVANAAEAITKAQYGEKNRFTKVIEDFTKNDSMYALNHPMVKSSNNPGLLAHLLGDSIDTEETALILRSALGDPAALDELSLQRAYITDALKTARGDLDAADEYKLFAAPDGSGMIPFLSANENVIKEAKANYASLAESDKYFAKLMQLGEGGGTLTRTTGYLGQGIEDFVAKGRAVKFYDRKVGNPRIEVYQPTPFHRLYQKISWAAGERPAGIVNFNDPDAYREVLASVNRLRRVAGYDEATSKSLLDSYIAAPTPEAKSVAVINLESKAIRDIAKKYDIPESQADQIYNDYKFARTSALKSIKDNGFMVDQDKSILKIQQLESQSANYLPIMDFDLLDRLLKRHSSEIKDAALGQVDSLFSYAEVLQDLFKAGALLRLGYTIRNGIDSQLRIAASLGAMTSLRHLGPGLKNMMNNTVAVPSRIVDRYKPVTGGLTYKEVQKKSQKIIDELNTLKTNISEVQTKLSLYPDDIDLIGKLNVFEQVQQEKIAIYNHYADVLNRNTKLAPKQRIGTGVYKITASDGNVYELPDAFAGPLGDMFRRISSSGNAFERLVDSNSDLYMRKMSSKGIGILYPTSPGYFEQWAQVLRQQFGNSAVMQRLAKGESKEDIAQWLRNSPNGRTLRERLSIPSDQSEEYVNKLNGFLDNYLPVESGLRNKLRDITAEDLRAAFKDPTTLPVIHGHILRDTLFNSSDNKIKKFINTAFKFLGTLPEDALARHPVYVELYRREARRRLDVVAGLKKDAKVTVAEQEKIMSAAHNYALREMKGILFNIERKTNLATAFKYISPFFSAQENAVKTWLKLAVANPAIVNRGYQVWNAPNRAGLVTDFEGNVIPEGETTGNDFIWVGVPKGLQGLPGLQSLTSMAIPKQSLDIIFGGGLDVLYNKGNKNVFSDVFPVGPYVAIPASEILKKKPELEESLKLVLPFGSYKNVISGLLPAWFQKAQAAQEGVNSAQFASAWMLIYNTEQMKAKRNGLPPVSVEKINNMTIQYYAMRTVANLVLPFAPRFDTPYKFWMDKSREYRRLYGINADAKYLEDFPEFFSFNSSLSSNPTNIQQSQYAVARVKKYSSLVSELYGIEPKLIGLITNNFANYEFSQAARAYLQNKKISPATKTKFIEALDPQEAIRRNEAEKGWIIYNQVMDAVDNELQNRGLSSTLQKGAEDLALIKAAVIQKLSTKTDANGNPILDPKTGQFEQTAWSNDYLDSDGSKTNRVILGLSKILQNDKFIKENANNPTWRSIAAYLEVRKQIAQELGKRPVKGIEAKANADLKIVYDAVVNKLKNDDKLGFAYVYDRFLSQDLVRDQYLTPKGLK